MQLKYLALRLKVKHMLISLKGVKEIHIGEHVKYKGEVLFVNNGVAYPYWDLVPLECDENGKRKSIRVHEDELKKVWIKYLKYSLLFHYNFYMDNWYRIDLNDLKNGKKPSSQKIMGW